MIHNNTLCRIFEPTKAIQPASVGSSMCSSSTYKFNYDIASSELGGALTLIPCTSRAFFVSPISMVNYNPQNGTSAVTESSVQNWISATNISRIRLTGVKVTLSSSVSTVNNQGTVLIGYTNDIGLQTNTNKVVSTSSYSTLSTLMYSRQYSLKTKEI